MILDRAGRIEHATPEALRLLSAYFRDYRSWPAGWRSWHGSSSSGRPRARRRSGSRARSSRYVVNLVGGALLLEEERVTPPLTDREREILELVAAGKTNAEIAEAIWIAPGTVRKHLENVYEKLGVHSRTAAVATLNGE